jgi:purine-binding chemotaxis protein CheW
VEVVISSKISSLPKKTQYLIGVTNLRGEVLPVLEIAALLGQKSADKKSDQAVERKYSIILSIAGEKFALQIARVRRIIRLEKSSFSDGNTMLSEGEPGLISRIAKTKDGNILVLDLAHTLSAAKPADRSAHA